MIHTRTMRWPHVLPVVSLLLVPVIAHAQYTPAPPLNGPTTTPPPESTPEPAPAPPPPAPRPAPDTEEPPPPSHRSGLPTTGQWHAPVVEEQPASGSGFAVEVDTNAFASGTLNGGLVIGAHGADGSVLGFRFAYTDQTQKIGTRSQSTTAYAMGLAGRLTVAGSRNGLDLALGLDASILKAQVGATDAISGASAPSDASGFHVGVGPMLRYWIRPNIALGYLVEASYTSLSGDSTGSSGEKEEQTRTAIDGTFTLTANF
jgi:hypothetical protein